MPSAARKPSVQRILSVMHHASHLAAIVKNYLAVYTIWGMLCPDAAAPAVALIFLKEAMKNDFC